MKKFLKWVMGDAGFHVYVLLVCMGISIIWLCTGYTSDGFLGIGSSLLILGTLFGLKWRSYKKLNGNK